MRTQNHTGTKSGCLCRSLIVASLVIPASVFATTWYVSPSGSDSNPGTLSSPFKSITKAQSVASSGDTVYLRGGTYNSFTIAGSDSNYNYVHQISKSGISYVAYSSETPVFNFSSITTAKRVCGFHVTTSGVTFTGVQVTGTPVGTQKQSECFRIDGSAANCTFNKCACHDNAANGFYFTNHARGTCNNCDSYNNIGVSGTSAGNTDGFGAHGNGVTFSYCRSWHNSDDGYDCINSNGANTFDHCWSYNNGVNGGDANGFKIGGFGCSGGLIPSPVPVHTVQYCLVAQTGSHGFYANHQPGQAANWTHNTSYNNGSADFDMLEAINTSSNCSVAGTREVLHYNLAYKGTLVADLNESGSMVSSNTWTSGITPSDSDFQSVDATQMTRARNSDGTLPTITFMHPVSGSRVNGYGCF